MLQKRRRYLNFSTIQYNSENMFFLFIRFNMFFLFIRTTMTTVILALFAEKKARAMKVQHQSMLSSMDASASEEDGRKHILYLPRKSSAGLKLSSSFCSRLASSVQSAKFITKCDCGYTEICCQSS